MPNSLNLVTLNNSHLKVIKFGTFLLVESHVGSSVYKYCLQVRGQPSVLLKEIIILYDSRCYVSNVTYFS